MNCCMNSLLVPFGASSRCAGCRWKNGDACAFPVSEDDLEGRICYGGLDLSSTTDITAFVLVFPPLDEDDKYYVLPYFWIPEKTL